MTQPAPPPEPEEFLSLSELSRWAHMPTEKVRRELKKGIIQADARSSKEILFRKTRAAELVRILHKL